MKLSDPLLRRKKHSPREPMFFRDRGDVALALALPLLAALAWWGLQAAVSSSAETLVRWIPPTWDRRLGSVGPVAVASGSLETTGPRIQALASLVDRLAPRQDSEPWQWTLVLAPDDDRVNAMAFPGGTLLVLEGMLDRCEAPEDLAGVLAHEMVHVRRRHGVRNLVERAGLRLLMSWLTGGNPDAMMESAAWLSNQAYRRSDEEEADREGMAMLRDARIDPAGMVRIFRVLVAEEASAGTGVPAVFSDHPATEARLALLEAMASQPSGTGVPIDLGTPWLNVRFRRPAAGTRRP